MVINCDIVQCSTELNIIYMYIKLTKATSGFIHIYSLLVYSCTLKV